MSQDFTSSEISSGNGGSGGGRGGDVGSHNTTTDASGSINETKTYFANEYISQGIDVGKKIVSSLLPANGTGTTVINNAGNTITTTSSQSVVDNSTINNDTSTHVVSLHRDESAIFFVNIGTITRSGHHRTRSKPSTPSSTVKSQELPVSIDTGSSHNTSIAEASSTSSPRSAIDVTLSTDILSIPQSASPTENRSVSHRREETSSASTTPIAGEGSQVDRTASAVPVPNKLESPANSLSNSPSAVHLPHEPAPGVVPLSPPPVPPHPSHLHRSASVHEHRATLSKQSPPSIAQFYPNSARSPMGPHTPLTSHDASPANSSPSSYTSSVYSLPVVHRPALETFQYYSEPAIMSQEETRQSPHTIPMPTPRPWDPSPISSDQRPSKAFSYDEEWVGHIPEPHLFRKSEAHEQGNIARRSTLPVPPDYEWPGW
ncbi:hypothetical protein SISSUDRAFT_1045747 [Sistotremastrum suecicum HHB10207 ss-3]|uniref:Uncharacterized protein n=1 Tax=Sistotremastrum suecicum HHB10207 ss-3 TaxID=1314776 RepID=A0A166E7T0_9AGAM|nr:hypothetical protein SISSUDRAFT_1045747 [Sistotremastrum suecicum HHB10207 ss-3]